MVANDHDSTHNDVRKYKRLPATSDRSNALTCDLIAIPCPSECPTWVDKIVTALRNPPFRSGMTDGLNCRPAHLDVDMLQ